MNIKEQEHYKKRKAQLWDEWKEKHNPLDMTDAEATASENKFELWSEEIIEKERQAYLERKQ